jgi:hypothetical protein
LQQNEFCVVKKIARVVMEDIRIDPTGYINMDGPLTVSLEFIKKKISTGNV